MTGRDGPAADPPEQEQPMPEDKPTPAVLAELRRLDEWLSRISMPIDGPM